LLFKNLLGVNNFPSSMAYDIAAQAASEEEAIHAIVRNHTEVHKYKQPFMNRFCISVMLLACYLPNIYTLSGTIGAIAHSGDGANPIVNAFFSYDNSQPGDNMT
jgi:hypothetical protein